MINTFLIKSEAVSKVNLTLIVRINMIFADFYLAELQNSVNLKKHNNQCQKIILSLSRQPRNLIFMKHWTMVQHIHTHTYAKLKFGFTFFHSLIRHLFTKIHFYHLTSN